MKNLRARKAIKEQIMMTIAGGLIPLADWRKYGISNKSAN